jgi:hypothetical protein
MKNTYPWSKYFVVLMLIALPPQSYAEKSEILSGEFHHEIEDYFTEGRSKETYHLKDEKTLKRREIRFPNGKVPEEIQNLASGSKVKIKGKKSKDSLDFESLADSSSSSGLTFSNALKGTRKVLVTRVNFQDANAVCDDEALTYKHMFDSNNPESVKNYYRDNSKNMVDITGEVTSVKLSLSVSKVTRCDSDAWSNLANAALLEAGHDLTQYQHRMYLLPSTLPCSWAGLGTILGQSSWITTCRMKTLAHELGHNLGLAHAATETSEYGDGSDSMGSEYREFNAPHKHQLGWIADEKMQLVESSGVYRISPLNEEAALAHHPQILKIFKPDTNEYIYLSYRRTLGTFDAGLTSSYANRLSITRYKGSGYNKTYFLNALDVGGSHTLSSPSMVITNISRTDSYIEISISAGTSRKGRKK